VTASVPERPQHLARAAVLVAAAVAVAYASAFRGTFQFDDWNVVVGDPRVQSLGAWWASMPGIRPLLKLSWAANHASGLGLGGFHAVNVAIHTANAVLVVVLLERLSARAGLAPIEARRAGTIGALLFALHPVQTEAVTYVSGRSTSLAALLALGSIAAWLAGHERRRPWLARVVSPALLAGALAVKEYVAVVPAALVLVATALPDRDAPLAVRARVGAALRATAVPWAVVVAAAGIALASPTYRHLFATSLGLRGPLENLRAQARGVVYLAAKLPGVVAPNADPMLAPASRGDAGTVAAVVALAVALAAGLLSLRRTPIVGFGVLWFLVWLAPTNSLLARLDVANDRQLYVAAIGPAWLVAVGVVRLGRRAPRLAVAAAALACVALAGATVARNAVYEDEVRFWRDVTAKSPANGRAWNNLGYALALAGDAAAAEAAFVRALEHDPDDARAGVNLRLLREGALVPEGRR